jgi:hypothetical protein
MRVREQIQAITILHIADHHVECAAFDGAARFGEREARVTLCPSMQSRRETT